MIGKLGSMSDTRQQARDARGSFALLVMVTLTAGFLLVPGAAAAKKKGKLVIVPGISTSMTVGPHQPSGYPVTISGTVKPYFKDQEPATGKPAERCMDEWTFSVGVLQRSLKTGKISSASDQVPVTPDAAGAFSASFDAHPQDNELPAGDEFEFEIMGITIAYSAEFRYKGRKVVCIPSNRAEEYGAPTVLDSWHYVGPSS